MIIVKHNGKRKKEKKIEVIKKDSFYKFHSIHGTRVLIELHGGRMR
jgi:hypothetical protein